MSDRTELQPSVHVAPDITENISEAEEKFERFRKTFGFILGPSLFGLLLAFPVPGVSSEAAHLAAILALTVTWWVCESIPMPATALLAPALCVVLGVGEAKAVLAPFADPIIFIFIGSFMLARAMTVHGLDRRVALTLLGTRWVGASLARVLFVFGAIAAFLSMWLSNTACTAMLLPIAIGITSEVANVVSRQRGKPVDPRTLRFATALMLMTSYGASVGGLGTPIGTPPNLIGIGFIEKLVGVRITFGHWMAICVPAVLVMFVFLFFVLRLVNPLEKAEIGSIRDYLIERRLGLGKWSRGEINTLIAFATAIVLWTAPAVIALIAGEASSALKTYMRLLPEGVVAILAASLLFILPVRMKPREFTLTWSDATRIDWGTVLLFGCGIALGTLATTTGLASKVGELLHAATGLRTTASITFAAAALGIIISELTSNTAAATVVIPVIIALAQKVGIDPVGPAVAACMGASFGFMLPVSTAPNAMAYGTGMVPITKMAKSGLLFDIVGLFVIWATVMIAF